MNSKNIEKFIRIMKDYSDYEYHFCNGDTECILEENPTTIKFNLDRFYKCSDSVVFDLLHEIGHAKTENSKNARCVREYEATAWAIKHAKKYNIVISDKRKKEFQDDVYYWKRVEKALQIKFGFEKKNFYSDKKLQFNWEEM